MPLKCLDQLCQSSPGAQEKPSFLGLTSNKPGIYICHKHSRWFICMCKFENMLSQRYIYRCFPFLNCLPQIMIFYNNSINDNSNSNGLYLLNTYYVQVLLYILSMYYNSHHSQNNPVRKVSLQMGKLSQRNKSFIKARGSGAEVWKQSSAVPLSWKWVPPFSSYGLLLCSCILLPLGCLCSCILDPPG